jgi:antitoxin component of RelBE/YafQ-DinJ toxin-antitoxin module
MCLLKLKGFDMLATTQGQKVRSNVYLDVSLKQSAKEIFKGYGLSFSDGLNLLLKQVTDRRSPILIGDLDIEPVYPDDPDYKLIQEANKDSEKSYTLEEAFRLIDED